MQSIPIEKKHYDGVLCLLRTVIEKSRARPVCKKNILTGLQSRLESTQATKKQETASGFSRMQCCRDALSFLDENGWRRSYHQRLFHDDFIRACTRIFWKREPPGKFAREQCEILRRNNWSHLQQEVLISTPRRFGKTISVSMFAAAMLFSAPCVEISIYATCKRISQKLLRNVVKFFDLLCKNNIKGAGFTNVRSNMEELVIRSTQDLTDVRIINSYPSKVFISHTRYLDIHLTHQAEECMCGASPTQLFFCIVGIHVFVGGSVEMTENEVICCTRSSDEVTDFFVANGLGDCQDLVCKWMGIESASDLKLIEPADLQSTRFTEWARGSLTMVQHKKMLKAFS